MPETEKPENIIAKFRCMSVKKTNWYGDSQNDQFESEMNVVTTGTPENDMFANASPAGTFKVTSKKDLFIVGREYYFNITLAPIPSPKP